jgi:hypothetical protein
MKRSETGTGDFGMVDAAIEQITDNFAKLSQEVVALVDGALAN